MSTIVAAFTSANSTCMIADGRASAGDRYYSGVQKIIEYKDIRIGVTGFLPALYAIADILREHDFSFETVTDVFSSVTEIRGMLVDHYGFDGTRAEGDPLALLPCTLLITTPTKIFEVLNGCEVLEVKDFSAIGSGAPYALGSLATAHVGEKYLSFGDLRQALYAASCFDPGTDYGE